MYGAGNGAYGKNRLLRGTMVDVNIILEDDRKGLP